MLFGIPDEFIDHASREEMLDQAGLNAKKILNKLKTLQE
jgi:deoxyxylulose-5-phosphate synthase